MVKIYIVGTILLFLQFGCIQQKTYFVENRAVKSLATLSVNAPTPELRESSFELLSEMSKSDPNILKDILEEDELVRSTLLATTMYSIIGNVAGLAVAGNAAACATHSVKYDNKEAIRLGAIEKLLTLEAEASNNDEEKDVFYRAVDVIQTRKLRLRCGSQDNNNETEIAKIPEPVFHEPISKDTSSPEKNSVNEFLQAVNKLPSKYQRPAFQCMSDHRDCRKDEIGRLGCALAVAACLADELLTFTAGEN